MTDLKPLDISFSSANSWNLGYKDDAIAAILKVGDERPPTEAMKLGSRWHEAWEKETLETGKVPKVFGYNMHCKVLPEERIVKEIPADNGKYIIRLTGILDNISEDKFWIADHKCGKTDIEKYLASMQMRIYFLLVPEARLGTFNGFNPYTEETEVVSILGTKGAREVAEMWIKDIADEVYKHCQKQGMPFWRMTL